MSKLLFASLVTLMSMSAAFVRAEEPRHRTFLFTYSGAVAGLESGQVARVWLPVPRSDQDQHVEIADRSVPRQCQIYSDDSGENTFMYFEGVAGSDGTVPFSVVYRVDRQEVGEEPAAARLDGTRYLKPDVLVPVGGKPSRMLLAGRTMPVDGLQKGRVLYDIVDDRLQYRKDKPGWGRGDATWACESRFGNCTDFHSLFISLSRSLNVPAKFEMGFAIPDKRGKGAVAGYHCWAKFKPGGHGWVPVDIAEANQRPAKRDYYFGHLDENRVMFSTGRDLQLVPRQAGRPVNFLVYPYVEVDGRPYPQEKVRRSYVYQDLEPAGGKGQ